MPETHPKPTHEAPSATQAALVLRRWLHSEQVESPTLGPAHDGYRTIEAVLELTISRVDKGPIEQRLVWGAVPIKLHLGMGEEDENKLLKSTAVKKFMTTGKPFLIDFCRKEGMGWYPWIGVDGTVGGRPAKGVDSGAGKLVFFVTSHRLQDEEVEVDLGAATASEVRPAEPALTTTALSAFTHETTGKELIVHAEGGGDDGPSTTGYESDPTERDGALSVIDGFRSVRTSGYAVAYSIEAAKKTWLGATLFPNERMSTASWQWRLYRWTNLTYVCLGLLIGLLAVLVMYYGKGMSIKDYFQMAVVVVTGWGVIWWTSAVPLNRLGEDRIAMATEWWAGFDAPSQVEVIRTGDRTSHVQLVRYTARCSVCGSKVDVVDGQREFPRRLVGVCSESPREHIFSFDRVTRTGFPLRRPPI